jgi:hypothetical protein
MAIISQVTSAGAQSVVNLDYLPERLLLDTITSLAGFSSFSVVTSGIQLMSITSASMFNSLASFDNQLANATNVAKYLRLAVGRVNKQTTINATDSAAVGTPSIVYPYNLFASSTNISNTGRRAVESSINPSANGTFVDFEALFISPANFLRVQLTFDSGYTDEYAPQEVAGLFAAYNQSENGGLLGQTTGATVEFNYVIAGSTPFGQVVQAVIYASGAGSVNVLKTDYISF